MKHSQIFSVIFVLVIIFAVSLYALLFRSNALTTQANAFISAAALKAKLSPEAYSVMYQSGTERPFSSPLNFETRKGTYVSADTGLPLFRSEDKYDSGTGWPSFTKPISIDAVVLKEDNSLGSQRIEVLTKDSHAHLGHVFDDGPAPLGKRWCMNGVAMMFIPDATTSTGQQK